MSVEDIKAKGLKAWYVKDKKNPVNTFLINTTVVMNIRTNLIYFV